jgi:type IV pilus assembly protein PilB
VDGAHTIEPITSNQRGACHVIGEKNALKYLVLPLDKIGNKITVAAPSNDVSALRELADETRSEIDVVQVLDRAELRSKIRAAFEAVGSTDDFSLTDSRAEELASKLLQVIVADAASRHASDVHFEPVDDGGRVRYRIDRTLREMRRMTKDQYRAVGSVIKIQCNLALDQQRSLQSGSFRSESVNGRELDVRVEVLPLADGESEKFVLRVLGSAETLRRFPDLGMPTHIYQRYQRVAQNVVGLHIIAGPTSSGKTSTALAVLSETTDDINVMTVEDPVEMRLRRASQVQVDEKNGVTFATAMRSFMRADPDIILCGEIRDADTAKEAAAAGLAGRRVWATIHSPDTIRSVQRLVEFRVERLTIAQSLKSVLAQRMVRRLCPECRVKDSLPYQISKAKEYAKLVETLSDKNVYRMAKPEELLERGGCKTCGSTGVAGQSVVFEFLRITESIEDAIVNEAPRSFLERAALEDEETGYLPMRYHALELILNGVTSLAEVEQASIEMTES